MPFAITDILDLAPYLTCVAQILYAHQAYKGTTINFLAAEKNTQENTFSLPSSTIMAFRTVSGSIVFVESINFQRVTVGRLDITLREIIAILRVELEFNKSDGIPRSENSENIQNL